MSSDPKLLAPIWPALTALFVVVALSIGMVVADVIVDHRTTLATTALIDDALHSVTLADDIRGQTHALVTSRDPNRAVAIGARLDADLRAYEPLASSAAEREEWTRLQAQLAELRQQQGAGAAANLDVERTLDRLVQINRDDAVRAVATIDETDRRGIWFSTACVVVSLAFSTTLAVWLVRANRRHRALLDAHFVVLDNRSRELEAFAGRVAHDLRGPLAPIRGYADLLSEQVPGAQSSATRIGRAADRMGSIIDELLALSISGHPNAGKTQVPPVVREVVDELATPDTGVALALDECVARCSDIVLHQVVGNVVGNAIKYRSPARPLEVSISCGRRADMVEITIADNGIGMDPDTAARAFEPLFRASAVRQVSGHGLGLAIVQRTVEALGGSCSLSSELDRGTRVTLQIPSATSA